MKNLFTVVLLFISISAFAQMPHGKSPFKDSVVGCTFQTPYKYSADDTSQAYLLNVVCIYDNFANDGSGYAVFTYTVYSYSGKVLHKENYNVRDEYASWKGDNNFPYKLISDHIGHLINSGQIKFQVSRFLR